MNADVDIVLRRHRYDGTRLIDILRDVQHLYGHIPDEHLPQLATALNRTPLDIVETASFYHFFHRKPSGQHRIYLSNTVIAKMRGYQAVYDASASKPVKALALSRVARCQERLQDRQAAAKAAPAAK